MSELPLPAGASSGAAVFRRKRWHGGVILGTAAVGTAFTLLLAWHDPWANQLGEQTVHIILGAFLSGTLLVAGILLLRDRVIVTESSLLLMEATGRRELPWEEVRLARFPGAAGSVQLYRSVDPPLEFSPDSYEQSEKLISLIRHRLGKTNLIESSRVNPEEARRSFSTALAHTANGGFMVFVFGNWSEWVLLLGSFITGAAIALLEIRSKMNELREGAPRPASRRSWIVFWTLVLFVSGVLVASMLSRAGAQLVATVSGPAIFAHGLVFLAGSEFLLDARERRLQEELNGENPPDSSS